VSKTSFEDFLQKPAAVWILKHLQWSFSWTVHITQKLCL